MNQTTTNLTLSERKQPPGVYFVFLTEMWERFSYYGLTALLILYMAKTFGVPEHQVYAIYGAYGALVFTTPILGGFLADRFIGMYRAIIYGAILIAIGHFVLSVPEHGHAYFYLGLAIIIVGEGLLKPNISSLLGLLYEKNDPRRESGFTFAYMGMNLGTVIAPIICAYVAMKWGWGLAFSLAGMGMLIGLVTFIYGRKYYHVDVFQPIAKKHRKLFRSSKDEIITWVIAIATIIVIYLAMNHTSITGVLLYIVGAFTFGLLILIALRSHKTERNAMLLVLILTAFYVIFRALLQQSGGMLNLFTLHYVNRNFLGWNIPTGMFQAVEPLFILLLGPFYTRMWRNLSTRKHNFSYPLKFSLSLSIMGLAFALLIVAMQFIDANGRMSMWWINVSYLLQAAGELFIGPIGLGMISILVPQRFMGLFMGAWVLASAFANFVAAKIGALTAPTVTTAHHLSTLGALALYNSAFIDLTILAFASAVVLLLLTPWLKKMCP